MDIVTSTNIFCERADGSRIPMEQSILACAKAGYKFLDFGFVELFLESEAFRNEQGEGWKKEIEHYRELAQSCGMAFLQSHGTIFDFCNPSVDYDYQRMMLKRSIEGAKILGAPWIVCHPSTKVADGKLSPRTHGENVAFFKDMADYAEGFGVNIAIENMWGVTGGGIKRYAVSAGELAELVDDIARDNVGACWDVEHASVENLAQGDSIRKLGSRLKATHISDETGPENIHILPYTGFVNWDEVLQALADIGYCGAFAFEIQHYLPAMPLALVPRAMELSASVGRYMISILERGKETRNG